MTLQSELRQLGAEIMKSNDVRVIELNPTMKPDAVDRAIKEVSDHTSKAARSKRVVLVSFIKRT